MATMATTPTRSPGATTGDDSGSRHRALDDAGGVRDGADRFGNEPGCGRTPGPPGRAGLLLGWRPRQARDRDRRTSDLPVLFRSVQPEDALRSPGAVRPAGPCAGLDLVRARW